MIVLCGLASQMTNMGWWVSFQSNPQLGVFAEAMLPTGGGQQPEPLPGRCRGAAPGHAPEVLMTYVIWPASHQCPDGPHEPFREAVPALGKSQEHRSVSVTPEGHLPVMCFLSLGQTLGGWPLVPTVARPMGFSELVPTSGKGFCCRSHSKFRKMGGGHRIRPLLVAYIVCSPTLTGQPSTWGRILSIFNSGKGWGSDDRVALPCFEEQSSLVHLLVSVLSLPFVFGVSLDLCVRLIKGSTGFSMLNHPLLDARVAPPPTWARGSVGGSSESAAVGVRSGTRTAPH